MFKRYLLLRAFRSATVGNPLAPGLGELHQSTVRTTLSTNVRAIRAAAITSVIVFVFEAAKQAVYLETSIWTSPPIAILFVTFAAPAVIFAVLKRERREAWRQSDVQSRHLFDSNPVRIGRLTARASRFGGE